MLARRLVHPHRLRGEIAFEAAADSRLHPRHPRGPSQIDHVYNVVFKVEGKGEAHFSYNEPQELLRAAGAMTDQYVFLSLPHRLVELIQHSNRTFKVGLIPIV